MAKMYVSIPQHGLVEHNFVAAMATGAIEAQTPVKDGIDELQNGSILFIDRIKNEVTFEVKSNPYLMHSTERYYRAGGERGKASFIFKVNNDEELPRLIKLAVGDQFHTNLVAFDSTEFANEAAFDAALAGNKRVYGYVDGTDGYINATATADTDEEIEFILEKSTMQDDTKGYKVIVNRI